MVDASLIQLVLDSDRRGRNVSFLSKLAWFVAVLMLAGLAKLLFDNILYAAIMRWLSSRGIEESDMVAVVTANLIPIAGAIALSAAIYWLSLNHHATKAQALAVHESKSRGSSLSVIRRLFTWSDPLPIIATSLIVAFVAGIIWQINYGPLTQLRRPTIAVVEPTLTEAEKNSRANIVSQLETQLAFMRSTADRARDLLDNWQYKAQSSASDFRDSAALVSSGFYSSSSLLRSLAMQSEKMTDLADLTKPDFPDCDLKSQAFFAEVDRITSRRNIDVVFTLLNNIKLSDFRSILPECQKWIEDRTQAIRKRRTQYR